MSYKVGDQFNLLLGEEVHRIKITRIGDHAGEVYTQDIDTLHNSQWSKTDFKYAIDAYAVNLAADYDPDESSSDYPLGDPKPSPIPSFGPPKPPSKDQKLEQLVLIVLFLCIIGNAN